MKNYLPIAMLAMVSLTGCEGQKGQSMGIKMENLDTTAAVGTDFYQYACGGWMKNNPLSGEYSRFGSFDKLAEDNREQIKGLIAELASKEQEQGTVAQKIADIYNLALDSVRLNQEGVAPLKADLEMVAQSIKSKSDIIPVMAQLNHFGVDPYFGFYIDADIMDSKNNLFQLGQGGLSLGQKEYYLDTDEATTNIRNKFKEHIVKTFQLVGFDQATAEKNRDAVMEIETRIAEASFNNVELRDPASNYHKMSVDELKKLIPNIDWDAYLKGIGVQDEVKELSVGQIRPIQEVAAIINDVPLEKQIAYLQWNVIESAASSLNDEMYAEEFDFYSRTMKGIQEMQPRWKRAVGAVSGVLGEAVGQEFTKCFGRTYPGTGMDERQHKDSGFGKTEYILCEDWIS